MKTTIVTLLFTTFTTSAMAAGPVSHACGSQRVFPPSDLTYGASRKNKAECDATPNAVWVTVRTG